jgi:mono/diheme cytochrome c family protein
MSFAWMSPPRRRIALAALAVILLLDLGRSILARQAMSEPVAVWKPDPAAYSDTPWPPSAGAPADATPGQRLYFAHCALCHGPDGRGNGAAAPSMIPRPRDFTQGQFKYKSTPAGTPPSDDDIAAVIADGLAASGMPGWRGVLNDAQVRSLVDVVKSMSPAFKAPPASPIAIAARAEPSAASVARGGALYRDAGCPACHGEKLRGGATLKDAKGYPVVSRDLTAPWTFRGGSSPDRIWLRLTTGLEPGPMPAYADALDAGQRWDIVNYLLADQRIAPWAPGGSLQSPGEAADLAQRGRYLVHAEMCGLCHTEIDEGGVYRDDRYLAGGMRVGALPQGVFVSRNLTSDPDTGLGRASVSEIADAIRNGRGLDGQTLNFWGMPWMYLHRLSEADARAIATYLKTLPPQRNAIPNPLRTGFVETIVRKLAAGQFPIAPPAVLTYSAGSYANQPGPAPDRIQDWLATGQWAALVLALTAMPFFGPGGRRLPSSFRGWLAAALAVATVAACLAVGWVLYATPAIGLLPPDRVADGAAGSIPTPDVSQLPPEKAAMIRRGQYLFTVASCAFCHDNDGSGGLKISGGFGSGGGFGTIFVPNISSDAAAGVGAWSDAEIARAIRSGVARGGRPLYWQGMPWDHFSNWDEEDIRSIVAYVRLLPPKPERVPPNRPPAGDDCKAYTFWLHKTAEPGCKG